MHSARNKAWSLLLLLVGAWVFTGHSRAELVEPYFHVYFERDLQGRYTHHRMHKAYAIGYNNHGWIEFGHRSAKEASKAALKGCNTYVRKVLKIKGDTKCQLVMVDKKYVFGQPKPQPLSSNYLREPDKPLQNARILGDPAKARAILLALHGCDRPSRHGDAWPSQWFEFFREQGLAVIEPNSFQDIHPVVCGFDVGWGRFDPVVRLRVAQTLRTLANLKKQYPGKPIYIWGHSQGGHVAQLQDFEVAGIIVTGAQCLDRSIAPRRRTLHIFGDLDAYSFLDKSKTVITDEHVTSYCKQFAKKGKYSYVLVKNGTHFVDARQPAVKEALIKFLQP